jgi:hypothetical protein
MAGVVLIKGSMTRAPQRHSTGISNFYFSHSFLNFLMAC